ncbi:MAG: type II TA system antitoxin MqsA family protein [Acidobacteriota bacterium]
MTCLVCGGEMRVETSNFRYTASGLPNVTLVGVEIRRCRQCGESEVGIPNIEGLHRTLAEMITRQRGQLTPAEIKFLHKYLGLSGVDFARHMGVTPETVSRWEKGTLRMGTTAGRLLRWLVATREPASAYPIDMFTGDRAPSSASDRLGVSLFGSLWREARGSSHGEIPILRDVSQLGCLEEFASTARADVLGGLGVFGVVEADFTPEVAGTLAFMKPGRVRPGTSRHSATA